MNWEQILDNPIWYAALTNNDSIVCKLGEVCYFKRDIAWFAAMKENGMEGLHILANAFTKENNIILFTEKKLEVPSEWNILLERPLAQLIYNSSHPLELDSNQIKPLTKEHVGQMLSLTSLTKPGPFFTNTIEFGNYFGIFDNDTLVSMAGSRLSPYQYTEISAVCTHPDYLGRGYAGNLIKNQINILLSQGQTPFLHAYSDNPAISLYKKLGFECRKELIVYRLEKS